MKRIPASLARDLETDSEVDLTRLMRFVRQSYGIGDVSMVRRHYAYHDVNLSLKAADRHYFLKLHKIDTPDRMNIVAGKINMLGEHGLPVARVYPDLKGRLVTIFNGRACLLQAYAHKGQLGAMVNFTKAGTENMGRTLGLMHKIGTSHDPDNTQNLSLDSAWAPDLFDRTLADFKTVKERVPTDIHVIIKDLAHAWRRAALGLTQAQRGFVHNDFHLGNIKMKDGRVSAIFDFSDASFSWHAADMAATLQYMFMHYKADRRHIPHFIAGYRSANPLPDRDLELIPLFMGMRAAARVICNLKERDQLDPYAVSTMRKLGQPETRRDILSLIHR